MSPNKGKSFLPGLPDLIVIHYTAGETLDGAVSTLCCPENQVSAHLVIGRDGEVVQLIPFDCESWHAGESSWEGRRGLNKCSIGIELDNAGKLKREQEGFRSHSGKLYSVAEVLPGKSPFEDRPAYWHEYTQVQLDRLHEICRVLVESYGIRWIVGHDEVSAGRKIDPGPLFPMELLRSSIFNQRKGK
jgi:N-acetylmuramoyl-L-alanine amidase